MSSRLVDSRLESDGDVAEAEAFRAHCRTWLECHLPPRPSFRLPQGPLEVASFAQLDWYRDWQRTAHEAGLVGCDYPVEYGGAGRTGTQRIANEEMNRAGAPFLPNLVGLGMAAPAIFHHGNEAQKRRFLPKILSGDEIWCQGFSEPGAGSDLANVQTFARRDGRRWIVSGHKVWTSLAQFADWMILLARTDTSNKYGGLTFFVVPINASLGRGVTVRPLVKMTGEAGFNEVLFDDLEVDDAWRIDEIGKGWSVAMTTLLHERGGGELVTPASGGQLTDSSEALGAAALVNLARRSRRYGQRASDDPHVRQAIVALLVRQRAFEEVRRLTQIPEIVAQPGRLELQQKLQLSELLQDVARLGCAIGGMTSTWSHEAMDETGAPSGERGRWPLAYMNSYGFTIAAGANEVQRNILGERVLGLPKTR